MSFDASDQTPALGRQGVALPTVQTGSVLRAQPYAPGVTVREVASEREGVILALEGADLAFVAFSDGRELMHTADIEIVITDPTASLVAGTVGEVEPFLLRLRAWLLRHAYRYDLRSGLSNARIEPAAHQVFVAHRVAHKFRPRMILADEVGLGKTIEAGLIVKELLARGVVERILIVCPASIV